jgi:glycosyltransferase involved in cell wall biosynthesis
VVGEKIRVLHVITRMILGGAQENTLLTAARLDRSRYDVTLASGPTTGPEGSLEDRIPDHLPFTRIPDLVRNPAPVKDARTLGRLLGLVRRGRYHIVHTHTTKAGMLGRIAARLGRTPVVIHTPHGQSFHDYLGPAGSAALAWAERGLASWTDRIICLTEAERQDHLRFRIGPPDKFEVIHSGVDLDRFRGTGVAAEVTRAVVGLPSHGSLVACVARLVPVKGVRYLIEAMPVVRAAVPGATAVIVGDGPLRGELERHAAALGLAGAVIWLGLRTDVAEIMQCSDLVVVPSLNEGMGRVIVEAFSAGRPVVGSRVSGIQDLIVDGETGFLVPPADPRTLAEAIVRSLMDPERARAMGASARYAAEAFSADLMLAKIDALYVGLLASLGDHSFVRHRAKGDA